jgi:flavin-dependent dehydrogenase
MTTWDVIVVGAGPAGAIAARQLARLGLQVLLVDRATFPRRKVCGCCLNGNALSGLARAGLAELPQALGAVRLTGIRLGAHQSQAFLPLEGLSLSRDALDPALIEAAQQVGAQFLPGTQAKLGVATPTHRIVHLNGDDVRARVVIAADGLNGRLASAVEEFESPASATARIGAGATLTDFPVSYASGTIFMATGQGGYIGLVVLEDGTLDVAAAFDPPAVKAAGSLGLLAEAILHEAGFEAIPGLATAAWKGTPALTRTPTRIAGERWFAVGDASGYVEPFTGEGMAWAINGALALIPLVADACRAWNPALTIQWHSLHRAKIGRRQRTCRLLARALRSPWAMMFLVRALRWCPGLARPAVRGLNHPTPQEVPV